MTEGNPTVEEARLEVEAWVESARGAARELFRRDVDALIDAVERREREGVEAVTRMCVHRYENGGYCGLDVDANVMRE